MRVFWLTLVCFLLPIQALGFHLKTPKIDINTLKISHLYGEITFKMSSRFIWEQFNTVGISGDRLVIIDSPGGSVQAGNAILASLMAEQKMGTKLVCVVTGEADSMAFNILSHCDVRLAVKNAHLLFHHVALKDFPPNLRITAKNIRNVALEMDKIDESFCAYNAAALHLPRVLYEKLSDAEADWTAKELVARNYLDGIVTLPHE